MLHLRRPSYTIPLPAEAKVKNGFAHFTIKRGKKCGRSVRAPVTKDGQRCLVYAEKYIGEFTDYAGKKHTITLCTDRSASWAKLSEAAEKAKVKPSKFEVEGDRPLLDHLKDYREDLMAEGCTREHVTRTIAKIVDIIKNCRFEHIGDLKAEEVRAYLHRLRRPGPMIELAEGKELFTPRELVEALGGRRPAKLAGILKRENLPAQGNGKARRYPRQTVQFLQTRFCRGIGQSTSNSYLVAVKAFSAWLWSNDRAPQHLLVGLKTVSAEADRRHERRELEIDELRALLVATSASTNQLFGLTGRDRCGVYLLAMSSGLRASELASITPNHFDLAAHVVRVKATNTKNKKEAEQPIAGEVVSWFDNYLQGRPPLFPLWSSPCYKTPWNKRAAEMIRMDLGAAGIAYRDEEGRVADFHALRHSYVTLLSRSGTHPKVTQDLARHADIRQTMQTYSHTRLHDLQGAIEQLPPLLADKPDSRNESEATRPAAPRSLAGKPGAKFASSHRKDGPTNGREALSATGTDNATPIEPQATGSGRRKAKRGEILPFSCNEGENQAKKSDESEKEFLHGPCEEKADLPGKNTGFAAVLGELPGQDSNLDKESQSLLCYRYTTGYRRTLRFPFLAQEMEFDKRFVGPINPWKESLPHH